MQWLTPSLPALNPLDVFDWIEDYCLSEYSVYSIILIVVIGTVLFVYYENNSGE